MLQPKRDCTGDRTEESAVPNVMPFGPGIKFEL